MRTIDADAALKALRKCQTYLYDARDPELKIELSSAEAAINNLPTIQPEKEQLSCGGTTSDLISRQAAIDGKIIIQRTNGVEIYYDEAVPVGYLKRLPSVQPEPQEGRFERKRDGVFCSVCHYGWEFIIGVPVEVEREYHYCPNCGARMTR